MAASRMAAIKRGVIVSNSSKAGGQTDRKHSVSGNIVKPVSFSYHCAVFSACLSSYQWWLAQGDRFGVVRVWFCHVFLLGVVRIFYCHEEAEEFGLRGKSEQYSTVENMSAAEVFEISCRIFKPDRTHQT